MISKNQHYTEEKPKIKFFPCLNESACVAWKYPTLQNDLLVDEDANVSQVLRDKMKFKFSGYSDLTFKRVQSW